MIRFVSDVHVVCSGLAKELQLQYNKIGDAGAEKIAEALPKLTNLQDPRLDSHVLVQSMSARANCVCAQIWHSLYCRSDGIQLNRAMGLN